MFFMDANIMLTFYLSCLIIAFVDSKQSGISAESGNWRGQSAENEQTCTKDSCRKPTRYLLYDVNPGEGFNLRRDVYIRAAVFVKSLYEKDPKNQWTLVLPPWGPLPHWRTKGLDQEGLEWKSFFDLDSLNDYVSVCEFDDYLSERKQPLIDRIFYLLSFDFSKIDLQSEWLLEESPCRELVGFPYTSDREKNVLGWFWGFNGIYAKRIDCYRALGSAGAIVPKLLAESSTKDRAVMFDRFETLLHDHFGGKEYWAARQSMQFATALVDLSLAFLQKHNISPSAITSVADSLSGGAFVCAHLRRQDYLRSRPDACPSMREAALQLRQILHQQHLSTVFVATDGTPDDVAELRSNLQSFTVLTYSPSKDLVKIIKDGGSAIVEQAICRHARYFIGSYESTFSFRIQEEREILHFHPETTFNRFCKTADMTCEQPTRWLISDSSFSPRSDL